MSTASRGKSLQYSYIPYVVRREYYESSNRSKHRHQHQSVRVHERSMSMTMTMSMTMSMSIPTAAASASTTAHSDALDAHVDTGGTRAPA